MAPKTNPIKPPFSDRPIRMPRPQRPEKPSPKVKANTRLPGGVNKRKAPASGPNRAPKVTTTTKGRKPVRKGAVKTQTRGRGIR
jgi:hypothetical protein